MSEISFERSREIIRSFKEGKAQESSFEELIRLIHGNLENDKSPSICSSKAQAFASELLDRIEGRG